MDSAGDEGDSVGVFLLFGPLCLFRLLRVLVVEVLVLAPAVLRSIWGTHPLCLLVGQKPSQNMLVKEY